MGRGGFCHLLPIWRATKVAPTPLGEGLSMLPFLRGGMIDFDSSGVTNRP